MKIHKKKIQKMFVIFLTFALIISCTSCAKRKESKTEKNIEPDVSQMRTICELATMECYYHNVAKYKEEDSEGILWWKKDKHFWIEYSGIVKIGIDMSLVNIVVKDDKVTITLPAAKVLSSKVDETTLTEDSFIIDEDSAKIDAEDQTNAYKEAQDNMVKSASEDSVLLASAQQRAQTLLEDYIRNIGNAVNKQYSIEWNYLDIEGNSLDEGKNATSSDSEKIVEDDTK